MTKRERAKQYQIKYRVDDSQRPVFHVSPPVGWLNDPNGFSIYQNQIHLFYQYHPYSDSWGPMHWGHCISEDFVKWEEREPALAPDESYDAAGCFSGSAIETEEGHALVYTGVVEREKEDGTKEVIQHQCLAIGDGVRYEKIKENPIISPDVLPAGFSREDFRDPKIWKEGERYYLVAGNRNENQNGQVVLFESSDLRSWKYDSVIADNRGKYGKMWECPDFFALGGRQVLIVSPMHMQADGGEFHNGNQSVAMIGSYDRECQQLREEQVVSLDYGLDFYAPQTLLTEDGRRIMIAWMQSWDMNIKPEEQKWNGMMTIPRELELKDGVLYQKPVRELEKYRTESVICEEEICGTRMIPGIRGRVLDMSVEVFSGEYDNFTICFAKNDTYETSFRYVRTEQKIVFDRTYSGVTKDVVCQRQMKIKNSEKVKFRLLLDKFSAELFVNDGAQVFSATFYTPLEAEEIVWNCDGTARVHIEKYDIRA